MKKIKHSFASYTDKEGSQTVNVTELAKVLARNWGNIPKNINDTRAFEIHCLARAYNVLKSSAVDPAAAVRIADKLIKELNK